MTSNIIASIAVAAVLIAGVRAEPMFPGFARDGRLDPAADTLALTPASLAQAIADGENQAPRGLPVVAARIERWIVAGVAPERLGKLTSEYALMPYDVYLLTPFVRAASTAADAKRRAAPPPPMTPESVNADGIVLSVVPGPGANARSIAGVTLKRGDAVIRPLRSAMQPPAADGRVSGAFFFRLEDFSQLPVTLVCDGGAAPFTLALDADDLAAARGAIDVTIGPAAYLAKLRGINDANTKAALAQAERDTTQRQQDDATLYVKSSDYSVAESNNAFTKFRWKATIVNGSPRRRVFDLTAKFVDASGKPIETRLVPTEIVNGQSETEVKGEVQLDAAKARSVAKFTVVAVRKGM